MSNAQLQILEFVDLHKQEGNADKVYHLALATDGSGYFVPFCYARRGKSLNHGMKNKVPLDETAARKLYTKELNGQLKDRYICAPGISGNVFGVSGASNVASTLAVVAKTDSGYLPQLLNPISEEEADRYINDDRYGAQLKEDGDRRPTKKDAAGLIGINRKGFVVPLRSEIAKSIEFIADSFTMDGEEVGQMLHCFDLLELNGSDLRSLGFLQRYRKLEQLFGACQVGPNCKIIPLETTTKGKRELYERAKAGRREGVVFKLLSAEFTPDKPPSGGPQLKCVFRARDSFVVVGHNAKSSVAIAATDANGKHIPVGNVTIPANASFPEIGAICDVEYHYAYPGGSLHIPVWKGLRLDLDINDTRYSKVKMKPEEEL